MLLDRPIVVVHCAELLARARVNPSKIAALWSAADVIDAADVTAAVGRALDEPHRHSLRRRALADEMFYGAGRASSRAADCIYDVLSLPKPAGAPAPAVFAPCAAFSHFETTTSYETRTT